MRRPRRPDRPRLDVPPDGDGPWALAVASPPARRATGSRPRRSVRAPGTTPAFEVAATLPRYPVVIPGDRVVVSGAIRRSARNRRTARTSRGSVRSGTLTSRTLELEPGSDDPGRRLEAHPPRRRRGPRGGPARARGRAGRRHPDRAARPRRSRPGRGVHDGRRQPRRRHLRLEHRDRRRGHRRAAPGRLGRRRRSVVTVVAIVAYVAFAGASASVVRAALMAGVVLLARESGRAGRAATALGWAVDPAAPGRPAPDRRCGVPAVGARDRRAHRLGDADRPSGSTAHAGPAAAAGSPRTWASRSRPRPRPSRSSSPRSGGWRSCAGREPRRRAARRAGDGGRARRARRRVRPCSAGAPSVVGAILAAPAWVLLRVHRLDRRRGGEPAVRERRRSMRPSTRAAAIVAAGWRGRDRDGGRGRRAAVRRWSPAAGAADPAGPGRPAAGVHRGATGRSSAAASRRRGCPGRRAARRRRPRRLAAARPACPGDRPRRRAGRRDPGRRLARRPPARRRRSGPGPAARRARPATAAVGPADRRVVLSHPHEDHVAGLALLLERYRVATGLRAGDARTRARVRGMVARLAGPIAPARRGLVAGDRLAVDEIAMRVLWPARGCGPVDTTRRRDRDQQRVDRPARGGRWTPVPARRRRRGRDRPAPAPRGPAAPRPAQGRPPREPDGHDPGVRRGRPPEGRRSPRPAPATRTGIRPAPDARPARGRRRRVLRTDRDGTVASASRPAGSASAPRDRGGTRGGVGRGGPGLRVDAAAIPVRRCRSRGVLPAPPVPTDPPRSAGPPSWRDGDRCRPVVARWSGTIATMTVPRRVEAASLLLSLDPPPWFVRHARAVAEVAALPRRRGWRAAGIAGRSPARGVGGAPPRRRQDPAARPTRRVLPHGDGSAAWLTRPATLSCRARSPTTRSPAWSTARRTGAGRRSRSREERIVAYADKRAGQRLESMDARFASWRRRYPTTSGALVELDDATWQRVRERRSTRSGRLSRGRRRARRRPPPGLDGDRPAGRPGERGRDDHAARLVVGRRRAVGSPSGRPVPAALDDGERRAAGALASCAATSNAAASIAAAIHERVATPVMFGGGTLAVVANAGAPGAPRTRTATRSSRRSGSSRPATRSSFVEASQIGRQGPDAEEAGRCGRRGRRQVAPVQVATRRPAAWPAGSRPRRASRARSSRPGAAKELAERVGGFVTARATSNAAHQTGSRRGARQARALPRRRAGHADDVRGPRPRGDPGLGLGIHRRGRRATPRPALGAARPAARDDARSRSSWPSSIAGSASCSRSATGWRRASGLPAAAKAMGIASEFRAETLRGAGPRLDRRRSWRPRSTALARARRDGEGRARHASRTRRSVGWRSRCG